MHDVARLPLHSARYAVANIVRVCRTDFLARKDLYPAPIIAVEPILGFIDVAWGVEMRIAHHPAERAAFILVDVAGASPPAILRKVLITAAALVPLAAQVQRDGAFAIG